MRHHGIVETHLRNPVCLNTVPVALYPLAILQQGDIVQTSVELGVGPVIDTISVQRPYYYCDAIPDQSDMAAHIPHPSAHAVVSAPRNPFS